MTTSNAITILVVEDNTQTRQTLKNELEDAGMVVIEAHNAADALLALDADPSVEAVVTDIHFESGIDGLTLTRLVKSLLPDLPIMIASGDPGAALPDLPPGCRYLAKPFECSQVVAEMRAL